MQNQIINKIISKPLKMKKYLSIILIVALLEGCISIRDNKVSKVELTQIKFSTSDKEKKNIFIDWRYNSNDGRVVEVQNAIHEKIFRTAIIDSNCCNIVSDKESAEIVLAGSFEDRSEQAALIFSVITGLSLYTIPSWLTVNSSISVNVKVKNKPSNSRDYYMNDSLVFAQWLPFLFVLPFRDNAIAEESKMKENLYRNLILQIKKDGIFD